MPIRRLDAFLLGATTMLGLAYGATRADGARAPGAAAAPAGADRRTRDAAAPSGEAGDAAARDADAPSRIPARGWWRVARRVVGKISEDDVLQQAAGVTFYALLALFPALAVLVSLYGMFADPGTIHHNLGAVSGIVPDGGMQLLSQQIQSLTANSHNALSLGLIVGLATSLWSSNAGIKALFDALNAVYEEREKRGYFTRTAISLTFTVGAILFILVALAGVVVIPAALAVVGLGATTELLIRWLRWPVLLVIVALFLALLYRYGPSRHAARWRWVSWGAGFASVSWIIVSVAFSWYVQHFGSYNKTYGSLGAAVGFMTWIWLSTTVILIGGEVNAELEHTTARDSTTGRERPMGARGATKADTVAG
jgi:membrane protein